MLGQLKGFVVSSGLAAYLRSELEQRRWTNARLAAKAGLDKSSITYIFNSPNSVPRLDTLAVLANVLDVPLVRLIKLCGFEPGEDDGLLDQERIAILLEQFLIFGRWSIACHSSSRRRFGPSLRILMAFVSGRAEGGGVRERTIDDPQDTSLFV